jgi:hypothetical protein
MIRSIHGAAGAVLVMLAACASYSPRDVRVGQTAEDVMQQLGEPTGRYKLAQGGTRLEYARGPYGKHTFMIDLDAQGRVTGWQQVLTEKNFASVRTGMAQEELLATLGRPSEIKPGGWQGGKVWSYRYDAIFCQWFQASVKNGQVTGAGYAPDPMCDANDSELSGR